MHPTTLDYLIIGAGISGLTAAYELQKSGKDILLVEKYSTVGGVIETKNIDGFILEYGANSTLLKPEVEQLVSSLNLKGECIFPDSSAKNRYLEHFEEEFTLHAMPRGFFQALFTPLLTPTGKLAILKDLLSKHSTKEDESVASFFRKHFGAEFTARIVTPALSGIWATDIETLSVRSALPLVWKMEQESDSLILGAIKRMFQKPPKRSGIFSFKEGFSTLTTALAKSLKPNSLKLNTEILNISYDNEFTVTFCENGINGEIKAKKIILTTPALITAKLISNLSPTVSDLLSKIPYSPLGVMHLAYKKDTLTHPLNSFGFLSPVRTHRALLGAIFSSSIFPNRAPADYSLLTCFVGGATRPQLADINSDTIAQQVIGEVGKCIGASVEPKIISKRFWPMAIPSYPLNHHLTLAAVKELEETIPGLHFLGNWRGGVSVGDCVKNSLNFQDQEIPR
jgi:oxygen-dependent protoporphyrinogen oxidase